MRGPSRHTTTTLVAGALARAATARARSETTKPLGAVRDARERERAAGDQEFGGSARHAYLVRSRR